MPTMKISIPDGLDFSDLRLSRSDDGSVIFSWEPIEAICKESDIDPDFFRHSHEDNVSALIVGWYAEHRQRGGEQDAVAEELLEEIRLEDLTGQPITTRRNQ